jgi:hypothetical protein
LNSANRRKVIGFRFDGSAAGHIEGNALNAKAGRQRDDKNEEVRSVIGITLVAHHGRFA